MLWKPTDPLERGRRLNRRRGFLRRSVRECWRRTTRRFRRFRGRLGQRRRHREERPWFRRGPLRQGLRVVRLLRQLVRVHLRLEMRCLRQRLQRWKILRRRGRCLGRRRGGLRLCFRGERRRRMRGVRRWFRELAVGQVAGVEAGDLGLRAGERRRRRRERRELERRHLRERRFLVGRRCRVLRRGGRAGQGRRRCRELAVLCHLR
jgi:hypothetical protein